MATHSSVLAWRIPGTEEPGGLPSMGLHRVGHDWSGLAAAAAVAADSILKSRDITFPRKVHLVKAMVFPVVMYGCESWTMRKLSAKELMLLNCDAGEDFCESLGQQGDQTSQSKQKSTPNIHWKDWSSIWSSITLATWCKEPNHWKRSCWWKRLKKKGTAEDDC